MRSMARIGGTMFFGVEGAENIEKTGQRDTFFGPAGAENYETFRPFSRGLSIFAKIEDFMAWKCIVMQKMTKKSEKLLYIRYFSKFIKGQIFRKSQT